MPSIRPTLIASDSPVADEIQASVEQSSGRRFRRCTFDDCRQHLAWHKPGLVLLAAADPDDWGPLTAVVHEIVMRCSPLTVALVHTEQLDGGAPRRLAPLTVGRFPWPAAAAELCDLVRAAPDGGGDDSLADELADRLLSLTPSLAPLAERLALAAAHDLTILLTGETGTGKTFLARLLHEYSPRRPYPFLMVPCGAQPANLFESCFFGHVKGAFTGALQTQKGKFAAAGKGTILLDEIDTLGLEQQASLLRVIETGEYEPVGGHETCRSEARIIAASNWDLEGAVTSGKFRQDLYYRLNVLAFRLPPLRERRQDIPLLARGFAAHFSTRFGKQLTDVTPDALAALEAFPWPGNIRQMENVMQQAVLVAAGPAVTLHDLPESVRRQAAEPAAADVPAPIVVSVNGHANGNGTRTPGTSLLQNRSEYERRLIQQALEECKFNRSSAARALGISRVTLHKKIKQYGLTNLPLTEKGR